MKKIIVSVFLFLSATSTALAADGWGVLAETLGVYAAYRSALSSMLAFGEDVNSQIAVKRMDLKENGVDKNPSDNKIVNDVMNRLLNKGNYALRSNSLPFMWAVNNSSLFNASCYPNNYISINKKLVRVLEEDESALAAVLAHEMIHGLMQHSANSYAEAVAGMMGAAIIGAHGNVSWERLNGSVGYGVARNVILPAEIEADEKGFYLMTSAGFNPAGGAIAMAKMRHYSKYETKNIFEYDGGDKSYKSNDTFSDHPETLDREQKLATLMTEYGVGHVTVKENEVFADGGLIFKAKDVYDAYRVAGALSKAFHDYDSFQSWNLNESVYSPIKKHIHIDKLNAIVKKCYENEDKSKRILLKESETKRQEENYKIADLALKVNEKNADKYRYRSDAYSDYLMGDMAMFEINRAKFAKNQSNVAECIVMEGRAYAAKGDYKRAIELATKGILMDGKNEYNYLNRADIYYMQGDLKNAIKDVRDAVKVNDKNIVSWQVLGDLLESFGDKQGAIEAYKTAYNINHEADVPFYLLIEIDKKAYEKRMKARQNIERQLADGYNEKYKKERGK